MRFYRSLRSLRNDGERRGDSSADGARKRIMKKNNKCGKTYLFVLKLPSKDGIL
jgi:hypothetical protein